MIKNGDDKEIVKDEYEIKENNYNKYEEDILPNHYIGRENYNMMLSWRKIVYQVDSIQKFHTL